MNLACYYSNNKKLARVKNPLQIYRKEGYLMSNWDTKFLKKGYTFDDILLIPAESHVLPNEVNMQTKLAKNLTLNIPIVTAAMDTVTDSKMAIAIARAGGLGAVSYTHLALVEIVSPSSLVIVTVRLRLETIPCVTELA